jgi:hypothetical protein
MFLVSGSVKVFFPLSGRARLKYMLVVDVLRSSRRRASIAAVVAVKGTQSAQQDQQLEQQKTRTKRQRRRGRQNKKTNSRGIGVSVRPIQVASFMWVFRLLVTVSFHQVPFGCSCVCLCFSGSVWACLSRRAEATPTKTKLSESVCSQSGRISGLLKNYWSKL